MTTLASLRFFDVVLWLHITSVVIAFGVLFTYPLIVPLTVRSHPRQVAWMHDMQVTVGRTVITPAAALVLITGIYLAADADVFSKWWVTVPLIAILVILGLGGAYFAPRDRRLAELARRDIEAAAQGGEVVFSREYEDLGRQVGTVGAFVSLLVVLVIFIMVAGPLL
jgi:small-conductance mechanosensitive channel